MSQDVAPKRRFANGAVRVYDRWGRPCGVSAPALRDVSYLEDDPYYKADEFDDDPNENDDFDDEEEDDFDDEEEDDFDDEDEDEEDDDEE